MREPSTVPGDCMRARPEARIAPKGTKNPRACIDLRLASGGRTWGRGFRSLWQPACIDYSGVRGKWESEKALGSVAAGDAAQKGGARGPLGGGSSLVSEKSPDSRKSADLGSPQLASIVGPPSYANSGGRGCTLTRGVHDRPIFEAAKIPNILQDWGR